MTAILTADEAARLVSYVDIHLREAGCDHSHRFTEQWAASHGIDWPDLLDVLESNGAFCDCEVALNLPAASDLGPSPDRTPDSAQSPWMVPDDFQPQTDTFTRQIVCKAEFGRNTYAENGEVLVPPPYGTKARKRVRKSMHFFVGLTSGLPAEVGFIAEVPPVSAAEFTDRVRASALPEFEAFTVREAAFVLSKLAGLKPDTPVATHFLDKLTVQGRKVHELRIHKIFLRK